MPSRIRLPFSPLYLRRTIRVLSLIAILYLVACTGIVLNERGFLYHPFDGPTDPVDAGLTGYKTASFTATDGAIIPYWEHEEAQGPVLLYFHGNGGGLHAFTAPLQFLADQKFHVIAMEYRGYPGAPTKPTERGIVTDAITLTEQTRERFPNRPLVLWGYSLGSGVAVQTAAAESPDTLILEAPFTATVDRAAEIFPWIPVHHLMRDQFLSREMIGTIQTPLLILHGTDDRIIPIHLAEQLYKRANSPKEFKSYPETGHLDLMQAGAYHDAVRFINDNLSTDISR